MAGSERLGRLDLADFDSQRAGFLLSTCRGVVDHPADAVAVEDDAPVRAPRHVSHGGPLGAPLGERTLQAVGASLESSTLGGIEPSWASRKKGKDQTTMCGLGRLVLPAMLVGIVVGSIAGSLVGWLAAAAVVGVLLIVGRQRLSQSCGLPPQTGRPFEGLVHGETEATGSPAPHGPRAPEPDDMPSPSPRR